MNYRRRKTIEVNIGGIPLGSDFPIRVQSMTNTSTMDTPGSVAQCLRISNAGADYVRLTAQGVREAHNIGLIRSQLRQQQCLTPLVADIHFNPKAAFEAAQTADKVRINPGNFVDPARTFKQLSYTDQEYALEVERVRQALIPFINICRENHTAVRIGVNHGSLSDRIMSRYGDTPAGMVESAMEFLRVFVAENFSDVVISIKASNTVIMVETVRRLVAAMDSENMHFPLHLGVTEAGDGEDGRIKSAVGIGTLLAQGIGDTIRVSLSEDPELEIPVARKLVDYITSRAGHKPIPGHLRRGFDPIQPTRRQTGPIGIVGGKNRPIVIASCRPDQLTDSLQPDFYFCPDDTVAHSANIIIPQAAYCGQQNSSPLFQISEIIQLKQCNAPLKWLKISADTPVDQLLFLKDEPSVALIVTPANINVPASIQALLHAITDAGINNPAIPLISYPDSDDEWIQVKAGADFGSILLNGFCDGIWLDAPQYRNPDILLRYQFAILQATRQRISKTEFISCPGCGRTLYDLQSTIKRVKEATQHLSHLKIGIMGCIVNGPGEMADADYGYVGAAAHRISLYKGKQCIEKNIPEDDAIPHLIALIKDSGDWIDPA